MILLVFTYLILVEIFIVLGLFLQRSCLTELKLNPFNSLILSLWLGYFTVSNTLLLAAGISSLSFLMGALIIIPLTIAAIKNRTVISDWLQIHKAVKEDAALFIIIFLVAALLGSFGSDCGDTGNYHFQAVKWLSEYGLVPGLANIEHRLGFASNWYTIPAVLNNGLLENRVQGIMGGLVYIFFLIQATCALINLKNNNFQKSDWVSLGALLLVWPFRVFESVSISPNLGIIFGVCFFVWLTLLLLPNQVDLEKIKTQKIFTILLISSALIGIKLTALPALIFALLWAFYNNRMKEICFDRIYIFLLLFFTIPARFASLLLSGYFFYPASFLNFSVSWRYPLHKLERVREIVWDYWSCGHYSSCSLDYSRQLLLWAGGNKTAIWLILLSIIVFIINLKKIGPEFKKVFILLALLQLFGLSMTLTQGPGITFLTAWLSIIPLIAIRPLNKSSYFLVLGVLLLISRFFLTRFDYFAYIAYFLITSSLFLFNVNITPGQKTLFKIKSSAATLILIICFILSTGLDIRLRQHAAQVKTSFLIPAQIYQIENCPYTNVKVSNYNYWLAERVSGSNCQCWQHELPCTLEPPTNSVTLRNYDCGLRCGFYDSGNI